ncbi:MAG TPA: BTAD domain-containing putative transcriptional regulator [Candidatus Micrarchaeaceae archaeon]|nr:BTAD domain-containing putative transcriptional regulator [Candidatus Micrarchaeaceae archaeon]
MLRIYLSGEVQAERDGRLLRESKLGGRQGRFVLTYLVSERKRAVTQSGLAEALWPESLPPSWTVALSAIISRLRSRLATLGLVRSHIIGNAFGCYQFSAPADTWVDLEAALAGVDAAEGFVAAGNAQAAYGPSLIATTILRRPFLAGDAGPWAESKRVALAAALVRALDTRVEALAANGEVELAMTHAREAVRMEPYRESGYRRLMRMQIRNGDRGEAIRSYKECRRLLESELGVGPSEETEALYREIAGQAV